MFFNVPFSRSFLDFFQIRYYLKLVFLFSFWSIFCHANVIVSSEMKYDFFSLLSPVGVRTKENRVRFCVLNGQIQAMNFFFGLCQAARSINDRRGEIEMLNIFWAEPETEHARIRNGIYRKLTSHT